MTKRILFGAVWPSHSSASGHGGIVVFHGSGGSTCRRRSSAINLSIRSSSLVRAHSFGVSG